MSTATAVPFPSDFKYGACSTKALGRSLRNVEVRGMTVKVRNVEHIGYSLWLDGSDGESVIIEGDLPSSVATEPGDAEYYAHEALSAF